MRRALLCGAQIEGLRGVHHDLERMEAMLRGRGFTVAVHAERQATRAGILEGYDRLIEASAPGDAAVVYFAGHGYYARLPAQGNRVWRCIAPTDLRESTRHDWRGITSWELSIKQAQLTARTKNVTVLLDCCHAAQMSRSAAKHVAIPRALPHPEHHGLDSHLDALRARYGAAFAAVETAGNRDAVRILACDEHQAAWELADERGRYGGVFTSKLLELLGEVGDAEVPWATVVDALRARVLRMFPSQRPDIEGPARRKIFSLVEVDERRLVPITATPSGLRLPLGELHGVARGDRFDVLPAPGAAAPGRETPVATVEVTAVQPLTATVAPVDGGAVSEPALAFATVKRAERRAVVVDAPPSERAAVATELAQAGTLRPATANDPCGVAIVRVRDGEISVEDERGPLFPAAPFPRGLAGAVKNVRNLAAAQALRELEGEHGVSLGELELELGVVTASGPRPLPEHGSALGLGDRLYVRCASKTFRRLYVHVFNVGVRGKITRITHFAPAGVVLERGDLPLIIGAGSNGVLYGYTLHWAEGLSDQLPRLDEILVIATTENTSLAELETQEVLGPRRAPTGRLAALLGQLRDGLSRDVAIDFSEEGFAVRRFSYSLVPRRAALASASFAIDDNPYGFAAAVGPDAWFANDRGPAPSPPRAPVMVAIRLAELVAGDRGAELGDAVRLDALVTTRAPSATAPYAAWTQRLSTLRAGQRLRPDAPLYVGPLRDFVDITLLVSPDTRAPDLAALLRHADHRVDLRDALAALLDGSAPCVNALGGSLALTGVAYELLGGAGRCRGLYRASFHAGERYGAGLHPREGVYHASECSFALSIEEV
jgi:Caspase domain